MKNKAILFVTLVLSMLAVTVSAQVKQVFQVLDFNTKQPVVGATSSLYGQPLTTNAKGVAVATLPANKKGAYLPIEQWKMDGYTYIGRLPESFGKEWQTSDTIKYYMADNQKFRADRQGQTLQLFRYWYDDAVMEYLNDMRETMQENPDDVSTLANNVLEATLNAAAGTPFRWRRSDAADICHHDLYWFDKPVFADALRILRSGDVDSAVKIIRSHIDTTDNSQTSLEWIELYRIAKDLYIGGEDDGLVSDYTVYLYKNQYSPKEAALYILDLDKENRYELADSIIRMEKSKNKDPRYTAYFVPSPIQYMADPIDKAKLKVTSEERLSIAENTYREYPNSWTLGDLYWSYRNLFLSYAVMEDSVSASHAIDSLMRYLKQYQELRKSDKYADNQMLISQYQSVLGVILDFPSYAPEGVGYELIDGIYAASKENYDNDPDNLFLQLQLAENALFWLQNAPQMTDPEEIKDRRLEVVTNLNDVQTKLAVEFPDYYTLLNVKIASQLMANCLVLQCEMEKMQDAFRRYEQSFDAVNAIYPKTFVETYLRFNNMVDGYLTTYQMFTLTTELSEFTDRLLAIQADNDPQRLLVLKAERANTMAEALYGEEAYDESIGYYMQSNEFYEKALQNDEKLWIPYLTNYLQMGDAHLSLNQFDKAIMTYQKILDFEPQIPASIMPQYVSMKASVNYYVGDAYKSMGEISRAEKEYKAAEKLYKKAISMGDTIAYHQLGEMYWTKAVLASQQNDFKKCKTMVEKSVNFYEQAEFTRPLTRYEHAKSVMIDFYKEAQDAPNYYRSVADLAKYYRKFAYVSEDYMANMAQYSDIMLRSGYVEGPEAIKYGQDVLEGLIYLDEQGHDVDLPYLRTMFTLARVYRANDSIPQAIDAYKDCLQINEYMYKDTAEHTYKSNMTEIYPNLATCYEIMAEEIDTAYADMWYYRAIDTRDTLIDLLKEINDDGDVNITYQTAVQYKNNTMTFYHLDMFPSAQDYLDKSNELLLMLYNSEYKTEVEEDIILNYYIKGVFYADNNDEEKALENFRIAVDYGDKADTSEGISRYYFMAVNDLLEHLKKDASANAAEIAKLTKKQKELAKHFGR
jgi:hypothetical protein